MKYTIKVKSKSSVETLSLNLLNPLLFKEWMEGLSEYNIIEGESQFPGCKTELVFRGQKGRSYRMIEKIISVDHPNEIVTSYETSGVYNECRNRFYKEETLSVYEMETIFDFKFPVNLYIWIFKFAFKKQTLKGMISYRNFIEDKLDI